MTSFRCLLFVLAALLFGAAASPASATLTVVPRGSKMDTNFPGHDLRSFRSEDAMNCAQVCDRTRGCMAWTWVKPGAQGPGGMCWLKSGAPTVVKDSCCMSGLREPTGQREANIDRPGMDYKSFDLSRPAANLCEQACMNERACKAWTYVAPGVQGPSPRCWLKKGVPNPVANNCCTSGVLR